MNLDVQIKGIIVQRKQEKASCTAKDLSGILKEKEDGYKNTANWTAVSDIGMGMHEGGQRDEG